MIVVKCLGKDLRQGDKIKCIGNDNEVYFVCREKFSSKLKMVNFRNGIIREIDKNEEYELAGKFGLFKGE